MNYPHPSMQYPHPSMQAPYGAPAWYGGATPQQHGPGEGLAFRENKGFLLRGQRLRMNFVPICLCLFIPWAFFAALFALESFSVHYESPGYVTFAVAAGAVAVIVLLYWAYAQRFKHGMAEREPSWVGFMFLSMALAWILAVLAGDANYLQNMKPYYDQQQLGYYYGVYPNRVRGQQIMDAGSVEFANGSYIDTTRSMGFKNEDIYCVAPIVIGPANETFPTFDFWAVGKQCCSGNMADFHCPNFNDPSALGGLRIMREDDRPYYRLAVQQAEATYNIHAVHPLFFTWVSDAKASVEEWSETGHTQFKIGIFGFFLLQAFLVAAASIAFSRIHP